MSSNLSTYVIVFAAGLVILMLLSTVKNHKPPKKIKAIWHGHVIWQQPSEQDVWQQTPELHPTNIYTVHGPKTRPNPINFDADIKAIEDARMPVKLSSSIRSKCKHKMVVLLTTYNRKGYVDTFSQWINTDPAYRLGCFDLVVHDDASSQYGESELRKWFPRALVIIEKKRRKADRNTRSNFEWFVDSDYDIMVNIDSDSILNPSWYDFITKNMPNNGFATLYHSNAKHHQTLKCDNELWCNQDSTGALGMVMSHSLVKSMLVANKNRLFDWGIIDWLKTQNIPVRAPHHSLTLHYGYYGQNNSPSNMLEVADGFEMASVDPSIQACVDWWMEANKPDKFCPQSSSIIS